jgi:hypothetical protein
LQLLQVCACKPLLFSICSLPGTKHSSAFIKFQFIDVE